MKKLVLILIVTFNLSIGLFADGVQPTGTGTSGDPYQVANLDNLLWVSTNNTSWSSYFEQTADIDASATSGWNNGEGFSPIGIDNTNFFSGNYDGQGYEIDGLFIDRVANIQSLFGFTNGAAIANLGVTNVNISGTSQTAGLVGYNTNSVITNCFSTGILTGDWTTAGLVGRNNSSEIRNCYADAEIYATGDRNGGFVGANSDNSVITNCYSMGSIVCTENKVGGFAGENNNNSIIENCYSTTAVSGGISNIGGFLGYALNGAQTNNSFWDTQTSGQSTSDGGTGKTTAEMQMQSTYTNAGWDFIGETANGTDDYWGISNNNYDGYPFLYWQDHSPIVNTTIAHSITQTSAVSGGVVHSDGGSLVTDRGVCWSTSSNPTIADNYTTDGTGTGSFASNLISLTVSTEYYYRAYATNSVGTSYGDEFTFLTPPQGNGTSGDPYEISTLIDLRWLSETSSVWDSHFIQTADIDASTTNGWNSGEGFSPIGIWVTNYFSGSYDGQGYEIDNLYFNRPASDNLGFFGHTFGAEISNLGITNINMSGASNFGSLIGIMRQSNVINCFSTGSIEGSGVNVGGLVGSCSESSSITNSNSTVTVLGTSVYVGGLVGNNLSSITNSYSTGFMMGDFEYVGGLAGINNGTITNCYSTADVYGYTYGNNFIGGLVGKNNFASIMNSYSTGTVFGNDYVGGLVGFDYIGTITNCYSIGNVTGGSYTGGLIGYSVSSSVTDSFWDTGTSGQSWSNGGTGKSTAEMKDVSTFTDLATVGLDSPWDFVGNPNDDVGNEDIWNIDDSRFNDGYPFLSWQNPPVIPGIPQNVTISISLTEVIITWDPVANAASYKVYSSDNPYSGFEEDTSGVFAGETWSGPIPSVRKFYYLKAVN